MDVKHVESCEYHAREGDRECRDEVKKVMDKLIYERKKNFQGQDNYCRNPSVSICPNVYCNIYTDLHNWFGFKNCKKIDTESLNTCFTDIANGGVGYYEKLIVLGGRILELYSELHFFNKYNYEKDEEVLQDLCTLKSVKEVVFQYLYVQKRKNRVNYRNSLYLFGYSYLYTPLFFRNKNSIIKYVKACIAYAVKFSGANIFSWMPSLIEHIYHSQKVKGSEMEEENELIQDLQEFFGYQFDYVLPRIAECFSQHNLYISTSHLTGLQIVRIFANEYFSLLADDVNIEGKEKTTWVREETEAFLNSHCIEIFSGCMLSLHKYLGEKGVKVGKIKSIFEMLLSSCWVLGSEKRNKVWACALVQRLRQVQLLTQITTIEKWSYSIKKYNDLNIQNFVKDIYNFNNINGSILSPFQLQNVNIYLPPKEGPLKEIPYYTTLADRYKDRFPHGKGVRHGGNDSSNNRISRNMSNKNCQLYDVINNITNNIYKRFRPRRPRNRGSSDVTRLVYTNRDECPPDMSYHDLKASLASDDSTKYDAAHDLDVDDEEEDTYGEEEDLVMPYSAEEGTQVKGLKTGKNGIPVKIKYIKDAADDRNSKYVIEIPKRDLAGRGSKNHVKAVLWGNGKKGLEIKLPSESDLMPDVRIR
ncbi:conserved protein, unknown function [Plasmodium knowlesi strain H]|uniref:Uncharacterized protein n=2 Tax=Plasmodium knowlesi TaxID=5850 RepID=B3L597_PLAKH|nr:conserved protein, unknown function [Plasmodium knowlesi strain H]OTN64919.1 Uncharacterized protein PKNOH_S120145900 [Plasmodium knowlesi]CAA9988316.1 conserved protein, unknown function [Plasmodium knowlesi strain H]VVS77790.1 conserved protein, unknown function [Plasmodium knowlesi strain H]|eukprot:XP_002259295.1 hypothetical protein, conserved in Plasmodium species [Plasmodium knowlesi strain H]